MRQTAADKGSVSKKLLAQILLTLGCKSCELSPVEKRAQGNLCPGCSPGQVPQLVTTTTLSCVFTEGPQTQHLQLLRGSQPSHLELVHPVLCERPQISHQHPQITQFTQKLGQGSCSARPISPASSLPTAPAVLGSLFSPGLGFADTSSLPSALPSHRAPRIPFQSGNTVLKPRRGCRS